MHWYQLDELGVPTDPAVTQLSTPFATVDAGRIERNIGVLDEVLRSADAVIAPHGKTTMSPSLWRRQLDAGAWAITVATPAQARVAAAHGVPRILHAGAVVVPADIRSLGALASGGAEVILWCDDPSSVELLAAHYPSDAPALGVLVDRGTAGARTGARTVETALRTAEAVRACERLTLHGVAAWEGSLRTATGPATGDDVAAFCREVVETFTAIESAGLFEVPQPVISAGGSQFPDVVAASFAGLRERALVVLRSGCYLTHDDGMYHRSSPFDADRRTPGLLPAVHVWGSVVSRPEPGLVLINVGKRDIGFDEPPRATQLRRDGSVMDFPGDGVTRSLNDQHAHLLVPDDADVRLGDLVRFGISHPCLTFDKWRTLHVIDDCEAPVPLVIGGIRTWF